MIVRSILIPGSSAQPWRPPASRPARWPSAPRAPPDARTARPAPSRRSPAWA